VIELQKMKDSRSGATINPKESEQAFYKNLIVIGSTPIGKYSVKDINTLEYALILKMYGEYLTSMDKQEGH
jgi:hypothetical protein